MADSGGGNVFTRHIGPLPMWAWTAIVGAVIVGWAWYKNRQGASSGSSQSSSAGASQVPEFVNQTYTTVQPPSAPGEDDDTDDKTKKKTTPPDHHNHRKPHRPAPDHDADDKPSGTVHKKPPTRKSGPVRRKNGPVRRG